MNNKYALITGASSGIGKALAHEFARDGYNLVLVSQNEDKLSETEKEFSGLYPDSKIVAIAKDLTEEDAVDELVSELKKKDVTIDTLVNDAGVGVWGSFVEVPIESYVNIIRLNIEALTRMTSAFLPQMVERKSGNILNLGSIAGFQPGPLMSVYHASKAYVVSLSEALSEELKGTDVQLTCLCPGATDTNFFDRAGAQDTKVAEEKMMSPVEVAAIAYKALKDKENIIIPGASNKIITFMRRVMSPEMQAKSQKKYYETTEE